MHQGWVAWPTVALADGRPSEPLPGFSRAADRTVAGAGAGRPTKSVDECVDMMTMAMAV